VCFYVRYGLFNEEQEDRWRVIIGLVVDGGNRQNPNRQSKRTNLCVQRASKFIGRGVLGILLGFP
jgi:hypothetical protein